MQNVADISTLEQAIALREQTPSWLKVCAEGFANLPSQTHVCLIMFHNLLGLFFLFCVVKTPDAGDFDNQLAAAREIEQLCKKTLMNSAVQSSSGASSLVEVRSERLWLKRRQRERQNQLVVVLGKVCKIHKHIFDVIL